MSLSFDQVTISGLQLQMFLEKVHQMFLQVHLAEKNPEWVQEEFEMELLRQYQASHPWIPVPFVSTPDLYADDTELDTTEELVDTDFEVDSDSEEEDPDFSKIDFTEEINLNDLY